MWTRSPDRVVAYQRQPIRRTYRWTLTLLPEGRNEPLPSPILFSVCHAVSSRLLVLRADIGQSILLPIGSDVFGRVEFRRIAGEVLHPQSLALPADEIVGELTAVGAQAVPDDQQRSSEA
jgi:hypothetical protein